MSTDGKIVLFDIPLKAAGTESSKAGEVCWSPNVWKTRLLLNYKNIPFETQWIDLPDIGPTLRSFGAEPHDPQTTGASVGAQYTLPTIKLSKVDEGTGPTYIIDSLAIASRLEELYPNPSLHLKLGLHTEAKSIMMNIAFPLFPVLMPDIRDRVLTEHALPYWTRTREALFGSSIDEFARENGGEKAWAAVERTGTDGEPGPLDALKVFLTKYQRNEGPFTLGSEPSYADFVVIADLECSRRVNQETFERIARHDRRIRRLWEACGKWLERDR